MFGRLLKKLTGPAGAAGPESLIGAAGGNDSFFNRIRNFPDPQMMMREGLLTDLSAFELEPLAAIHSFNSDACRLDHFVSPRYRYWCKQFKDSTPRFHRKQWEWVYICAALHERGMLAPGKRGLGFGVGREPLVDLFASLGATVLATDQASESAVAGGWTTTGQHSSNLDQLRERKITAPPEDFDRRVSFRVVDMNTIDADLTDFDFCWSSCCFEHLGSIDHGLQFIHNTMRTLKPGGISVHTTELNLSSDDATYETPNLSLFRKCDFQRVAHELREAGHDVAPLCFYPGAHPIENYVDLPPFKNDPHIRLEVAGYAVTSFGLIVRKGGYIPAAS